MFLKIWQDLKNLRLVLLLMVLVTLLDALLSAFSISLILPLTNAALGGIGEQSWITRYVPSELQTQTSSMLYLLGGVLVIKLLVSVIRVAFSIHLTENIRLNWQLALSRKYILQPYSLIAKEKKGRLVNDLIYEADNAASFIYNYLNYLAQLFIVGTIFVLLITVNGTWLLASILAGIIFWFILGRPYFQLARRLGKRGIALSQDLNSALYESLNGIKDIKISHSEAFQLNKIELLGRDTNANRKSKKIAHAVPALGKEFVLAIAVLAIALVLPSDLNEIKSVMPQVALFIAAAARLTANISTIVALRFKITSQFPSFKLILKRLKEQSVNEEELYIGKTAKSLNKQIEIESLFFHYNEREPVLKGLDMRIEKGQTVCIRGASGAGKTTLIDILTRLYDPTSGAIQNGKTSISDYSLASWRRMIGYVPQDPIIYHGTIRENICLGDEGINEKRILKACQIAMVNEFVDDLPEGYDTLLHESGSNLSGGQKKRLALARALAHDCKLIVLDETTSAIEEKAEQQIITNLQKDKELTLIIITHRKSTLKMANACYMIKNGKAALDK